LRLEFIEGGTVAARRNQLVVSNGAPVARLISGGFRESLEAASALDEGA
jgi:hypothetical protein